MNIENQRIKEWRQITNLSEEQFAKETGLPVERIQKIEAGKIKVTLKDIVAVADAFFLSMDYLIGRKEKPSPILMSEEQASAWAKIERLAPEQLDELIRELRARGLM